MNGTDGRRAASKGWDQRRGRLYTLVAAALLLCAVIAPAQDKKTKRAEAQARSVQGVVTAPNGKPISEAVVQLKNTKSLQILSFITKNNGSYYFHELSPDIDYELTATHSGASSSTKTLSSFDSRKNAIINLQLKAKK
jgi:Carboxypeptidase regulatory-like domain